MKSIDRYFWFCQLSKVPDEGQAQAAKTILERNERKRREKKIKIGLPFPLQVEENCQKFWHFFNLKFFGKWNYYCRATQCANYERLLSHIDKNFVKATLVQKILLKRWFHEYIFSVRKNFTFFHTVSHWAGLANRFDHMNFPFIYLVAEAVRFLIFEKGFN